MVGYPLETVLAEKNVTMVDRGDATTRERDFADVFLLTGRHVVDAERLATAVRATGTHRGSDLRPLHEVLVTLASSRQPDWERFVRRSGRLSALPDEYARVIRAVADFADPILTSDVSVGQWDPATRRWTV